MSPVLFVSVCCVHRAEQPTPNHWTPVPVDTSGHQCQWTPLALVSTGTGLASRAWKTAVMRRGAVSWFQVGRVFVNTLFRYVDMNICTDTERNGHMITRSTARTLQDCRNERKKRRGQSRRGYGAVTSTELVLRISIDLRGFVLFARLPRNSTSFCFLRSETNSSTDISEHRASRPASSHGGAAATSLVRDSPGIVLLNITNRKSEPAFPPCVSEGKADPQGASYSEAQQCGLARLTGCR